MTSLRHILPLLFMGLLLYSCVNEPFDKSAGEDPAGNSLARITLAVTGDTYAQENREQQDAANRAAYPYHLPTLPQGKTRNTVDEGKIANLHILIFDSKGAIVSNVYRSDFDLSQTNVITLDTRPGTGMQIYAIANGDVNDASESDATLNAQLKEITSIDQLNEQLVKVNGNGLHPADRLTMVGNATVNISNPHVEKIALKMKYLAAKVTVNVAFEKSSAENDLDIKITGWDMVNIPVRTNLIERPVVGGSNMHDAVSGSNAQDYLSTNSPTAFEPVGTSGKAWAQTLYLFENRRGGRVERADAGDPIEKYPGMKIGDIDPRGKAWWAPPGATYMLIHGTASQNGHVNKVIYKIYLGGNVFNDYNTARGKYYTFNVKITGINEIDIDSSVDWGNSSFTVTPYGDLTKMDAHPDFRVLRIGATAAETNTPGYVTVEVLNNNDTPCNWLSLSPLNLYRYGIKQAGNPNQPFDDATGCFVRTKYTPTVADELSFDNATFGMTRKLTQIPFPQLAVFTFQDVVIYADEFNDTGERTAKVRVTYYKDENGTPSVEEQQEFDIVQQDAIKITNDLYIERYEESNMYLQPGISMYLQGGNAGMMQWGYSSQVLYGNTDRYTDGAFLTANAVYKSVARGDNLNAPTWNLPTSYTDYRDLYPSLGGKVNNPSSLQAEPVYYYPVLATKVDRTAFFDPIYNSSAARYCHEKNWDANGNGIIDVDEAVWYLPSMADMLYVIEHMPTGTNLSSTYWTSSEEDAERSWVFNFGLGYNGSKADAKTSPHWVRCVKGKGVAALRAASLRSGQSDPTKISFNFSGNQVSNINIQDITGLPWTVTSSEPSWLKFNTNDTGTGVADSYSGSKNGSYYAYATANMNTTARTATITLTRRDTPKNEIITVTQTGVSSATVNKTSIDLDFLDEEPVSFSIDNKGTGLQWTVTSSQSWLKLVEYSLGGERVSKFSAANNRNLNAVATSRNPSTSSARTGILTLSRAGMENINISVTQKPTLPYTPPKVTASNWAGSNIYWDPVNNCLTFDDTGVKTHENYQGVAFYWGSLVAMSPQYPHNSSTAVLFSPATVQNPNSIPRATPSNNADVLRHHVLEQHDPENNIGDICRYMTKKGWTPGSLQGKKWRLPTCAEYQDRGSGTPPKDYSLYSYRNLDLYGRSEIPLGRMQLSLSTNLPACGWFEVLTGANDGGWWVGYSGTYWTGTAVDAGWAVAYMFNGQLSQSGSIISRDIRYPCAVRCVLEK